MSNNSANAFGAVASVGDAHNLTLENSASSGNTALGGALLHVRASADAPAKRIRMAGLRLAGNTARVGSVLLLDAAFSPPPGCNGCVLGDPPAPASGTAPAASMPASFTAGAPPATASSDLLPLSVRMFDAYGAPVIGWPDLAVSVTSVPATALSGAFNNQARPCAWLAHPRSTTRHCSGRLCLPSWPLLRGACAPADPPERRLPRGRSP